MPAPEIPVLHTDRLSITLPAPDAAAPVARYMDENREHHGPWNPTRPVEFFTDSYWRERLRANREEFAAGRSARMFFFERGRVDGRVLGHASLSEIMRGPMQACFLGYALDRAEVGRGLMQEALERVIRFAFDELRLHRVMANHLPTNERSARLLRRLGFAVEGYARDYLRIDGAWRDHVLTARLADDA